MELIPDLTRTIEADAIELAPNGTSLDLLQQVYRNPSLPLQTRMRAATAALPHEHPKLAVTAVVSEGDFANQLDQAIERSRKVSMIEVKPNGDNASSDTANVSSDPRRPLSNGKPPTIIDRRYRRW